MTAFTEAPWPKGVVARYLTVAAGILRDPNLTVDVTAMGGRNENAFRPECRGCGGTRPDFLDTEPSARSWAQAHASQCRAMMRPASDRRN